MYTVAVIRASVAGVLLSTAALAANSPQLVYLRVDHRLLYSKVGLRVVVQPFPGTCMAVNAEWPRANLQISDLRVTVYPRIKRAAELHHRMWRMISVGPRMGLGSSLFGDEYCVWGSGESGTIAFRRRNVRVVFSWRGDEAAGFELARNIDRLLRDDREIAPLGRFDPVPAISDPGVPKVLRVRKARLVEVEGKAVSRVRTLPWAYARIEPKFAGLGPRAKVRFWVTSTPELLGNQVAPNGFSIPKLVNVPVGAGAVRVARPSAEDDGRFILQIKAPAERTVCKLTMTAVNDMNLVVTREVEVVLEPQR